MKRTVLVFAVIVGVLFAVYLFENTPKTKTKTTIQTIQKSDTIQTVKMELTSKTPSGINHYRTKLEGTHSEAELQIETTGELLAVRGVVNYPEIQVTKTIKEKVPQSGLFLYAETSINTPFGNTAIGLDYQFRNKFIVGTSVSKNNFTGQVCVNAKLGYRIW